MKDPKWLTELNEKVQEDSDSEEDLANLPSRYAY